MSRGTPAFFATSATRMLAWVLSSSFALGLNSAVGSFDRPPMLMTAMQSATWDSFTSRMSSTMSSTRSRNSDAGSRPKNIRSSTLTE